MRRRRQRGEALLEFVLVCVQLFMVLFGILELARMVVVATTVANAARVGLRYAVVHGSTNTGSGTAGPNGPGNTAEIENVVRDYAQVGLLNPAQLEINVGYPDAGLNSPGSRVSVQVVYPYDPLTILPLGVRLGSAAQGVITF